MHRSCLLRGFARTQGFDPTVATNASTAADDHCLELARRGVRS